MRIPAARVKNHGFTFFELLAVIVLLAVLAILCLPLWRGSQLDMQSARCAGNLAQVGRAVAIYASDHDDTLPGCQHSQPAWNLGLRPYTTTNSFRCPGAMAGDAAAEAPGFTIALNDFLSPHPFGARQLDFSKRKSIPAHSDTILFAEAAEDYRAYDHFHFADAEENGYKPDAFADQVDIERHNGAANYLFADGHVDGLPWSTGAKPKLIFRGSRFVHPAGDLGSSTLAGR